jgi:hypothetical protein
MDTLAFRILPLTHKCNKNKSLNNTKVSTQCNKGNNITFTQSLHIEKHPSINVIFVLLSSNNNNLKVTQFLYTVDTF